MKVRRLNGNEYLLTFDNDERIYLENEADDNELTVSDILNMLLAMLFVGGYSNVIGKES